MFSGTKKWFTKDLLGFSLASFFNDFSQEMVTSILPIFIEMLVGSHYAPIFVGLASGFSEATASGIKLFSGWLSDRIFKYKFLLVIGYAVTPFFLALIGFAHYVWQVVILRTIAWVGKGLREPPRDAWLAKVVGKENYGKAFGFQRAFDTLGALFGPLVVFFALGYFSIQTIFLLALIPGVFSVFSIIFLTHETAEVIKSDFEQPDVQQAAKLPTQFLYYLVVRIVFGLGSFDRMLIILKAQEVFTGQAASAMIATGWTVALYAIFNLIRAMSEYGFGFASDYLNRKYLLALLGFGLFSIVCLLLMIGFSTIWWWLLIFVVAGISRAVVKVVEKAYCADLLPQELYGTGYGLLQAVDGICLLLSGLIVGLIWSSLGASYAFGYCFIISIVAMMLMFIKKK